MIDIIVCSKAGRCEGMPTGQQDPVMPIVMPEKGTAGETHSCGVQGLKRDFSRS